MKKTPTCSIVIPVYNRSELVADAIESIILQSFSDWELIIVDDGSTDDTWATLLKYATKDNRIHAIKRNRAPKGASACRNIGALLAKGEFLIFWDSDDLMLPYNLESRISLTQKTGDFDFYVNQLINLNYSTNSIKKRCGLEHEDFLDGFLTFKTTWGSPAVLWKREKFLHNLRWNEEADSWQDGDIHIRAITKGLSYHINQSIADGIIRSGIDLTSITYSSHQTRKHKNLISTYSSIYYTLNTEHQKKYLISVRKKILLDTINLNLQGKRTIAHEALRKGIFKPCNYVNYIFFSGLYSLVSPFWGLRGLYYRLFIKKKFILSAFFIRDKIKEEDIQSVIEKINSTNPLFKKRFPFSFQDGHFEFLNTRFHI